MIWLLFPAVFLTLAFIDFKKRPKYSTSRYDGIWGAFAFGAVFFVMGNFIMGNFTPTATKADTYALKSIEDRFSTSQSGSFFIAFGSFNSEEDAKYWYYRESEPGSGGYVLDSKHPEDAVIYETDSTPRLEVHDYYAYKTSNLWSIWAIDSGKLSEYRFYVPEGSINSSYELGPESS